MVDPKDKKEIFTKSIRDIIEEAKQKWGVDKKILLSSRNYRLDIPSLIIKGMGWKDDVVKIAPYPEEGILIISNLERPSISSLQFIDNIKELKWIRNKKRYQKELNQNLSPEGRKILHKEFDKYFIIKQGLNYIHELETQTYPKELREPIRKVIDVHRNYLKALLNYLVKDGGKKSKEFRYLEKRLRN